MLDENPSYVFFREIPPPPRDTLDAAIDGPLGSLGVPAARATHDRGGPARDSPRRAGVARRRRNRRPARAVERLVLAQDTGGAIRGAVRADFFWGAGDEAAREAGRMRESGRLWILWPTDVALPAAQ